MYRSTHAHTERSRVATPACWDGSETRGVSDLILEAWINALIIVCLINDHHLSHSVGAVHVPACARENVLCDQRAVEEVNKLRKSHNSAGAPTWFSH